MRPGPRTEYPSISRDGRFVEFYSPDATNLGGSATNQNVFRAGPLH
jgi:hypothetical protein